MPESTNLNVTPYYDDFDATENHVRTLFRPGFAIQARELTQIQSTLQNQIEKGFSHIFKEGTMIIPGSTTYLGRDTAPRYIKVQSTFGGETVDVSQYVNEDVPVTLTGATSGVKFRVIAATEATETDPATLFGVYTSSNLSGSRTFTEDDEDDVSNRNRSALDAGGNDTFVVGENLSADIAVQHGSTAYVANVASLTTDTANPTRTDDSQSDAFNTPLTDKCVIVKQSPGIFFVRGHFVEVAEQTLVVEKYNNFASVRIGFQIEESIVTPESDTSLLDNATGTSNFAAKGAHRLKITLTLSSKPLDSVEDKDFITIIKVRDGVVESHARTTEYSILEQTLARRTFDESGDYTVRPFTFEVKESVDVSVGEIDYKGVYAAGKRTRDRNTASDDLLALQVSPGKAYIKGHELDKIAPTIIDVKKGRDFNTINAGTSPADLGNYLKITNVYGTPDVTDISGETTVYKELKLHDEINTTRGTSNGTQIGVARVRTYQYDSGTVGENDATYRLYLFDINALTRINLSGTPSPTILSSSSNGGNQLTGVTSGATGFIYGDTTSGGTLFLTNVVGTFEAGEKVKLSDSAESDKVVENSSNADLTIDAVFTYDLARTRSVSMADTGGDTGQNFTADVQTTIETSGTSFFGNNGTSSDGTADQDDRFVLEDAAGGSIMALEPVTGSGTRSQKRVAKLIEPEKNVNIYRLPKVPVKTLLTETNSGVSDTQYTFRQQFVATATSAGVITLTAGGSSETFLAHTEADYTISILTNGNGTAQQGDIVSAGTGFSGAGTAQLTITNLAAFGSGGAKVKVMATLLKTAVSPKAKTTKLMKQLKVDTGNTDPYGTRPSDREISLGRADVFALVAVYEATAASTDAVAPTVTFTTQTGTFTRGEKITGSVSKATARIVDTTSPMSVVYTSAPGKVFTTDDTITGASSGATATLTAVTVGDDSIVDDFFLDNGQRDNFYDISRIVRRRGAASPVNRLLVIYDYLEHGSGDMFTVDSYSDVAGRMDYVDIPTYKDFRLQNTFDFRPTVENIAGAGTDHTTVDEITGYSFDFFARQYDGTGASASHSPKPASLTQADFEYYLPKKAIIEMDTRGVIRVVEGPSDEQPRLPQQSEETMKLGEMDIPAFTFNIDDVDLRREKHQRFTMKDIGKLQDRIGNLEYYTQLSLLERDAESFEITDANGLNRFKSGFIVDNFAGHGVGDVQHKDYQCSVDQEKNELRPESVMKNVSLKEVATTDAARAGNNYQKTGDLFTLPYTEVIQIEQPYATRTERVTPVLLSNWAGQIQLSPAGDDWFETEVAPALIVNVEGDFETIRAREFGQSRRSQQVMGTFWNSWETQWSGLVSEEIAAQGPGGGGTITRRITRRVRTGTRVEVRERIDRESKGTKVISRAMVPFVRSRNVTFEGFDFLPNTQVYPFFDVTDVSEFTRPLAGFSTNDSSLVVGDALVTSPSGRIKGVFEIPDPKVKGNPKFRTGLVNFRLTSSPTNIVSVDPVTAGETNYDANGIVETLQETIIATRNAEVRRRTVSETTTSTSEVLFAREGGGGDRTGGAGADDPLAQTFMVDIAGGMFITSVDLFFEAKDSDLPCTVEIREVVNGYPGPRVLPFGRVVKDPDDIVTDSTGQTATNFKFDSPIYLQAGLEYCIVVIANVPTYKVWIARMGETEIQSTLAQAQVGGTSAAATNILFSERTVSDQPEIGVLFKGHNNRTWAPSLTEDLKFNLYRAEFSTDTGTVSLENESNPVKLLQDNPVEFLDGSAVIKVFHPNHQMYSTSNNVIIAGVKSGVTTTLSAAITASSTTIELTSGTNFDDTSGVYSRDASNVYYIKIDDEIISYTSISTNTISSATRAVDSTTAVSHAEGATVELYMLHKIPFTEINKTHTAIANIEIDSYTISSTATAVIDSTGTTRTRNGGAEVTATENVLYDVAKYQIGMIELPDTSITASKRPTTATSPSGSQTSFTKTTAAKAFNIPLNENIYYTDPYLVASDINQDNEMSSVKSLSLDIKLQTNLSNVSPIIDTDRMSMIAVGNRINNIDSSSDVYPTSEYFASTESDGDNNSAIYITKEISLAQAATALKVFFAASRDSDAEIKVLYKVFKEDDETDFNEMGWRFFNDDGTPDVAVGASAGREDFREYLYTAGVTDDGLGVELESFIAFAIKIVMQSTNSAAAPRIRDFRAIALAT